MAVFVRIGLGVLLALAPALCCCHARWLTAQAGVAVAVAVPECCAPAKATPGSVPACLHCQAELPAETPESPTPPSHCVFCDGQSTALAVAPRPGIEPPAFAGEWLPVLGLLPAVLPAHPAFQVGVFPPERAGVDARSAALFERHVLRC